MTTETTAVPIEVYWRPGCPYCLRLRRDLDRLGLRADWRNIWEDEAARDIVQRANGGDETVPTVRVGEKYLTNPPARLVATLAGAAPAGEQRAGLLRRWLGG